MRNIIIQTFDNVFNQDKPIPMGLLEWCTTDRSKTKCEILWNIPEKNKRDPIKKTLPGAFPSIKMDGTHSGLICIDIDEKDNPGYTPEELKEITCSIDNVWFCKYSCSKRGVWALIPIKDTNRHEQHFKALETDFKRIGIRIDPVCSNDNRFRFDSYDTDPYLNEDAKVYTIVEFDIPEPRAKLDIPNFEKGDNIFKKFNQYANLVTILTNNGWKVWRTKGNDVYMTRPGKDGDVSGVVHLDKKSFYCFSSAASPIIGNEKGAPLYSACGLLLALECNNDNRILAKRIKEIMNIK